MDCEYSDQTKHMCRLIRPVAGCCCYYEIPLYFDFIGKKKNTPKNKPIKLPIEAACMMLVVQAQL